MRLTSPFVACCDANVFVGFRDLATEIGYHDFGDRLANSTPESNTISRTYVRIIGPIRHVYSQVCSLLHGCQK